MNQASPQEMHLPSAPAGTNGPPHLGSTSESSEESHGQEPLPGAAARGEEGEDAGGVDYISRLPDAILGEIISLLPTKAGARTQTLTSRWRRLWLSAPLNLDLSDVRVYEVSLSSLISQILDAHPGPARRFSIPLYYAPFNWCPETVDAWLRSPALDNLQDLDLEIQKYLHDCLLPASTFRSSATLHVVTIRGCRIVDGMVETLCFPLLRKLALVEVEMSGGSLNSIIAGCPVVECLLLKGICFSYDVLLRDVSLRINSPSLISFGFSLYLRELIIEDAPSLKRLLPLCDHNHFIDHVSVISAPNLEIVGIIYASKYSKLTFGDTVIQKLAVVNFTTGLSSIKSLAIANDKLDLELVINLMQCFPHLENLYIKMSNKSWGKNLWRRKYHNGHIKYLNVRLKTIVLRNYRGIKSQASFATFFILNAKMLQVMRFEGGSYKDDDAEFIARQRRLLQLEKRASRGARFEFSTIICHCDDQAHIKHVHDLSKADDPFKCTC
ncbi:unnamed protein product [Urochloa decumbens]|uniref:FBD domain-containing protein n=1 Tax=Urochloa decumbens TaxID=240449 RepID=A0ABC9E801_9POAL